MSLAKFVPEHFSGIQNRSGSCPVFLVATAELPVAAERPRAEADGSDVQVRIAEGARTHGPEIARAQLNGRTNGRLVEAQPSADQELATAFKFAGEDCQFVFGEGTHNGDQGA